jgi:hypothetical protein
MSITIPLLSLPNDPLRRALKVCPSSNLQREQELLPRIGLRASVNLV